MVTRIVSDSSCDILELDGVDFVSVPLKIRTEIKEYTDDGNLDVEGMVSELLSHHGRSYTACPSPLEWEAAFEGADNICVFTITKNLSGSYNSAHTARNEHLAAHPEKKIHIVDTLSAGPEITMAVLRMNDLLLSGMEFEAACKETDSYILSTGLVFALKSLHNFAQNGRVGKLAAAACGALGIQVIGCASPEGTLSLLAKARGAAKTYAELIAQMEQAGYCGGRVLIAHTMNESGAKAIKQALIEAYPNTDISCHSMRGLCSYYAEKGGILIGFEKCYCR